MIDMPAVPVAPSAGGGVSSEGIERSLRELWQQMEDAAVDVVQVRMLNLVVYLPQPPSPAVRATIDAVAVQHPGRMILLLPDDGPPRAEATIACRMDAGRQHACGEQITLHGSVGGHALHSLAVALLLAGLPVTVWWQGPVEFDDHVFEQLAKIADRFILDTSSWEGALSRLGPLQATMKRLAPNVRFSDLQWVELTSWRRMIAQAFDVPAARQALPALDEVVVEYGGSSGPTVASIMIVGWLASRLGWSLRGSAPASLDADHVVVFHAAGQGDRRLQVVLRPNAASAPLAALKMRTSGTEAKHFSFTLRPQNACIEASIELAGSAALTQVIGLKDRSPARVLGDELALAAGDPVYLAALAKAVVIAEQLQQSK